jgi:hypothetical protein
MAPIVIYKHGASFVGFKGHVDGSLGSHVCTIFYPSFDLKFFSNCLIYVMCVCASIRNSNSVSQLVIAAYFKVYEFCTYVYMNSNLFAFK